MSNSKTEDYIMPFGKFKGMRVADILKIVIVDKNGLDQQTGLKYLNWLCAQDWYKNKEIIQKIIQEATKPSSEEKKKPEKKKKAVKLLSDSDSE